MTVTRSSTFIFQRTHDVIITSLLRQNDAAMSFWRYNDVIITSRVHWVHIQIPNHKMRNQGLCYSGLLFFQAPLMKSTKRSLMCVQSIGLTATYTNVPEKWFAIECASSEPVVFIAWQRRHSYLPISSGRIMNPLRMIVSNNGIAIVHKNNCLKVTVTLTWISIAIWTLCVLIYLDFDIHRLILQFHPLHYTDATWASHRLKSPSIQLFVQQLVYGKNWDGIKAPHYWPFMVNPSVTGRYPPKGPVMQLRVSMP